MHELRELQPQALQGLSPETIKALAHRMQHIRQQAAQIEQQDSLLSARDKELHAKDNALHARQEEFRFKDAKLRQITFELARLKR